MFAENVAHNLCCQWKSQSLSPAHVLMRLYRMDNKAREGSHARIINRTVGMLLVNHNYIVLQNRQWLECTQVHNGIIVRACKLHSVK